MQNGRNPIEAIIQEHGIFILDGALATELERHGCNLDDPLWSAHILIEDPGLIYQVHTDYFQAGADCAITASYQATIAGLAARGFSEMEAIALIKKTVEIARKARDDFWKEGQHNNRPKPIIVASVGPYGAFLANGAEYVGNYGVSDETLKDFHRKRMAALIEAGADLLAMETIPSLQEAKVLAELLQEFPDAYAWLSFSMKDAAHISDGTLLAETAALFNEQPQIAAIGLNCAPTEIVTDAIGILKQATDKQIVVYPNSGETYDPATKTWHDHAACRAIDAKAKEWHAAGARLIGGCCRTTPDEIAAIVKQWRSKNVRD